MAIRHWYGGKVALVWFLAIVLGFLGLVLAIPLTCLGLAYYRKFILKIGDPQATT